MTNSTKSAKTSSSVVSQQSSVLRSIPRIHRPRFSDLPEILAIEHQVFDDPWTESDYQLHASGQTTTWAIGCIVVLDGQVVAHFVYEFDATTVRIIRMAVAPWHQRRGVGAQVIEFLKSKLVAGRTTLEIFVGASNLGAQLFLRRMGFRGESMDVGGAERMVFRWQVTGGNGE